MKIPLIYDPDLPKGTVVIIPPADQTPVSCIICKEEMTMDNFFGYPHLFKPLCNLHLPGPWAFFKTAPNLISFVFALCLFFFAPAALAEGSFSNSAESSRQDRQDDIYQLLGKARDLAFQSAGNLDLPKEQRNKYSTKCEELAALIDQLAEADRALGQSNLAEFSTKLDDQLPGFNPLPAPFKTYFQPYDDGAAEQAILTLIENAQSKIRIACYAFTDEDLVQRVLEAKQRGVDVQIVMDKTQSFGSHQKLIVRKLQLAGVTLFIGQSAKHRIIHCKIIIVDDRFTEDGSFNFTGKTAMGQDNTTNFSDSKTRAAEFTEFWNRVKSDCQNGRSKSE